LTNSKCESVIPFRQRKKFPSIFLSLARYGVCGGVEPHTIPTHFKIVSLRKKNMKSCAKFGSLTIAFLAAAFLTACSKSPQATQASTAQSPTAQVEPEAPPTDVIDAAINVELRNDIWARKMVPGPGPGVNNYEGVQLFESYKITNHYTEKDRDRDVHIYEFTAQCRASVAGSKTGNGYNKTMLAFDPSANLQPISGKIAVVKKGIKWYKQDAP
jgi:hypothetical protein